MITDTEPNPSLFTYIACDQLLRDYGKWVQDGWYSEPIRWLGYQGIPREVEFFSTEQELVPKLGVSGQTVSAQWSQSSSKWERRLGLDFDEPPWIAKKSGYPSWFQVDIALPEISRQEIFTLTRKLAVVRAVEDMSIIRSMTVEDNEKVVKGLRQVLHMNKVPITDWLMDNILHNGLSTDEFLLQDEAIAAGY